MAEWDSLGPEDQMTYWIGMVARADVAVDDQAREAFAILTGDPFADSFGWPRDTGRLLEDIGRRVSEQRLPQQVESAAHDAILAAIDAHRRRNRFVHDSILPIREGQWQQRQTPGRHQSRIPASVTTLDELRRCTNDLVAAGWRLFALSRILRDPDALQLDGSDPDPADDLLLLRGQFESRESGEIWYSGP